MVQECVGELELLLHLCLKIIITMHAADISSL